VTRERRADVVFLLGASGLALLLAGPGRDAAVVIAHPFVLGLALLFSVQSAAGFEPDTPVRKPWQFLSVGLFSLLLGEIVEVVYRLSFGGGEPFPSLADVPFLLAYPPLGVAFLLFLRAYRESDLSEEKRGAVWPLVAGLALVGFVVLRPIMQSPVPLGERLVSGAYAAFDLVALAPLLLLLRLTWGLRGGSVWKVWAGILFGFLLTFAGDVLFAYFQTEAEADLGPFSGQLDFLANVMFLLSYLFIARGTLYQRQLLRA
jgi:hypothetical protein